jgi:3-hydroxyisobutyrate dehydrogenase-like beta-hydroxyacid dehydrogenase
LRQTKIGELFMSDITVIGLGAMGSAIAKVQLQAGHTVTVWNRSPDKISPLVKIGASNSSSFSEAIQASRHILICVDCYASSDNLLSDKNTAGYLDGKTVIQFTTGTPTEARSSESWLVKHGANYLDGTLLCYPSMLGDSNSEILIGGVQSSYENARKYLEPLGGKLAYLGENIAAAAAVDLGALSASVALYLGVAHGAQICIQEGVEVAHLASVLSHARSKEIAEIIDANSYELGSLYDGASLSVWNDVVKRILSHAKETDSNSELPTFLSQIYQRGVDAGLGEEDRAALVKVLTA